MQDHFILLDERGWFWNKNQCMFINPQATKGYQPTLYVKKHRLVALGYALYHKAPRQFQRWRLIPGQDLSAEDFSVYYEKVYYEYFSRTENQYKAVALNVYVPNTLKETGWRFIERNDYEWSA